MNLKISQFPELVVPGVNDYVPIVHGGVNYKIKRSNLVTSGGSTGPLTITGEASGSGSTTIALTLSTTAVTSKLLTGYIIGTNSTISSSDSIIVAFGKIQAQVSSISLGGTVSSVAITGSDFTITGSPITSAGTINLTVNKAALTRTNDTNITVTLGGSPTTALLASTSLTLGWTGTLSNTRGGLGADVSSGFVTDDLLKANSATAFGRFPAYRTDNIPRVLQSDNTSGLRWDYVDLNQSVTNTLPPSNGGTGANNNNYIISISAPLTITGGIGSNTVTLTTTGVTNLTLPTSGLLMVNPMTSVGDIIIGSTAGLPTRLAIGTSTFVLTSNGTTLSWQANGGVTTMLAIGSTPNANGATIGTNTLTLQPASSSFGGVVTAIDQTFAGIKTFPGIRIFPVAPTSQGLYISTPTGLTGQEIVTLDSLALSILTGGGGIDISNSNAGSFGININSGGGGVIIDSTGNGIESSSPLTAGIFSHDGLLTANSTTNTVSIYRQYNLAGFDATGTVLEINDTTTSSGNLLTAIKAGTTLLTFTSTGKLGIGVTPNASVHIKAGTTTVGQLQLDSGSLLTSPVAGSLNYNGNLYYTKVNNVRLGITGSVYNDFATVGTTSTTPTDLNTHTLPASFFANDGDSIEVLYGLTLTNSTSTKDMNIVFAGNVIYDTGALTTVAASPTICIKIHLIRASSTSLRYCVFVNANNVASGLTNPTVGTLSSLTLTGTNIVKITGTAGGTGVANNDIQLIMAKHIFQPTAA